MAPISTLPETGKPGIFSLLPEKEKAVRPKQFTWVLLLKAYRAILPFKFGAPFVIRVLLIVSLLALFMECQIITHFKTVRLSLFQPSNIQGLLQCTYGALLALRAKFIGPMVVWLSKLCILLFLVQSMDRLLLCVGFFWIKFNKLKPTVKERVSLARDIESEGLNSDGFPMVLVQIPMRNEREVYAQSIASVCNLDWPREKLLIQVLDDSDEEYVRVLIESEVLSWTEKGVNIIYVHRAIRTGYKAGNLKSAMACDYVKNYEFVAIFDADFQPRPDFLKQTIPHFKDNPKLGLVQARWSFVNESENLLTRLQYVNMCYHFEVEQQVNGIFLDFFGFNGTGGVWRINALKDSGGWLERTTVEDMDIAVRAHLNGWKFIFLNDVFVQCELPESYQAYKMQQHRWNSGPVQLFRQCLPAILTAKLSMWRKAYLIFLFFLLRKLILPFYSFTLFCIILPLTMFIPEAELPTWAIYFIPILMSLLTIIPAPKSFPFLVPYLLFENTISVTKFNAMLSGLFQLGSAYEWVVTKKTGRSSERDRMVDSNSDAKCLNAEKIHGRLPHESNLEMLVKIEGGKAVAPVSSRERFRLHGKELGLAFVLLAASAKSMLSAQGVHFYFLLFQGLSFLLVGLDLVGEPIG